MCWRLRIGSMGSSKGEQDSPMTLDINVSYKKGACLDA